MISRVTGTVLSAGEYTVEIQPEGLPVVLSVQVPAYHEDHLRARTGHVRTLYTICTLDGGGANATSFTPRLVGFPSALDRRFFELLLTVKGLGAKRALRMLVRPPQSVALAISARDRESLMALPEVGKKLAETLIHELYDKVQSYLATIAGGASDSSMVSPPRAGDAQDDDPQPAWPAPNLNPDPMLEPELRGMDPALRKVVEEAVGALVTLGENRKQATRLVTAAINEVRSNSDGVVSSEEILAAAFRRREA